MSARTPASLSSSVYLTSEMVKTKQDCVGTRGGSWKTFFGTLQNCRQPQNNKLDNLKLEGFCFFSLSSQFLLPSKVELTADWESTATM